MNQIAEFFRQHSGLLTICKVVLILLLTVVLTGFVKRGMKKVESRLAEKNHLGNRISGKLLKNVLMAVLYIVGILAAIRQIPALSGAVTTLLAGSGVLAVVIGFAAQESMGNLISGIFLTLYKPFDVGDRVTLVSQNITGYVEDITLRHTVIRTLLDTRLLIPNSTMGSAIVENVNYRDDSLMKDGINVDVAYDSDLDLALRVMGDAIASHPLYAGVKPPIVLVQNFGSSGITLRGIMATKNPGDMALACSDARLRIKKAFDQNGIGIPFQTITIANQRSDDAIQLVTNK